MESKVNFNLRNVHYAVLADDGSYGTPVHVPGAVSITLSPAGDTNTFYADGIAYYVTRGNTGYTGSIEMARFPDQMMQDIFGFTKDAKNVLIENALTEPKNIALLFQVDGDQDANLYAFYNVSLGRPAVTGQTNTETKDVQTQTADLIAAPLADGKIRGATTAATDSATRTGWFSSVHI